MHDFEEHNRRDPPDDNSVDSGSHVDNPSVPSQIEVDTEVNKTLKDNGESCDIVLHYYRVILLWRCH